VERREREIERREREIERERVEKCLQSVIVLALSHCCSRF
jgi:hypothetical protein